MGVVVVVTVGENTFTGRLIFTVPMGYNPDHIPRLTVAEQETHLLMPDETP